MSVDKVFIANKIKNITMLDVEKEMNQLIEIGNSNKFYKNINMFTLWDILPYLKELQNMIGMKSVKESIFYQVIYYIQGMHERNKDGDYLHTIISGKSGCGKTTVSKILCNIYKNLNILSKNGRFKIAHREDFVAEYLGQTAVKTKKLLNSCIGGCLFVDEIYALGPGQKDKDSFSKEAIDTINVFLSEHKNDFVFIAAGYKDQIEKCFFSVNEGLRRRFQWVHTIEDYSTEDLVQIFKKMVREINWELNVDDKELVRLFKENSILFKDCGGSMENLLTKIKLSHSKRVLGQDKKFRFIITKDDVNNAISIMKQFDKKEEVTKYDYFT
jgi:SpoVK/Ycf46/Vps4 family AAA+-type ATPase